VMIEKIGLIKTFLIKNNMAFKLKNNLLKNFSPIRKVDMEDGILGKANNDGTIDINKNITDPIQFREVVKHEKLHQDQMNDLDKNGVPKLDYDDENVYWKGETYPRSKMDEGAKNLPWEKEVYDETKNDNKMETSFKLKGPRGQSESMSALSNRGLIKKAGDKIKDRLQHKKVNVYTDEGDRFPGVSDYAKKRTTKSKTYSAGGNKITKHKLMVPKNEYKALNPIYVEDRKDMPKGRKYFDKKDNELAKSSLVRTGGDNLYNDPKATRFSGHAATPKGTKKQLNKYFSDRNTFM
jgi:hypothetical protein